MQILQLNTYILLVEYWIPQVGINIDIQHYFACFVYYAYLPRLLSVSGTSQVGG